MLSKPIARPGLKYLVSFGILMAMVPVSASAEMGSDSFTIGLQVVPRCNLPIEHQSPDLQIQCSAHVKPAAVNISPAPASESTDADQNKPSVMTVDF